jgi:hypothetical protein
MVDIAFAIGNSDVNVPICWLYENNGVRQVSGLYCRWCQGRLVIEMGISLFAVAAVTRFLGARESPRTAGWCCGCLPIAPLPQPQDQSLSSRLQPFQPCSPLQVR